MPFLFKNKIVTYNSSLQNERERILEYKRQVQSLVNKSRKIVQLKPRNPDYRSNKPIILKALCDYKQDLVLYPFLAENEHCVN